MNPTKYAMQRPLDKCSDFANGYGLYFNSQKCKTLLYGVDDMGDPVRVNDASLPLGSSEKPFGHVLSTNCLYATFLNIIRDINVRTNGLKREFNYLVYAAKCKRCNAHCNSFYGTRLIDLSSNNCYNLCKSWVKSVRFLLYLHPRRHNTLLPAVIGSMKVKS